MVERGDPLTLTFRCPPGLEKLLPRPIPAVRGLPEWFKTMPANVLNTAMGVEDMTIKKCPPVIDAMTYGYLMPLVTDLEVRDGEFSWNFASGDFVSDFPRSPIGFHDSSQVVGSPFFQEDHFLIKFNSFWNIEVPPGYSLLFTHPFNRAELPFSTLTGLVDCDTFHHTPVHFPARWNDANFNGVLPKGTPVAQCVPVKRENWSERFEVLSGDAVDQMIKVRIDIGRGTGTYRHQFRAPKR
jgi:hypothetical protein